jgi:hypothetical protein
MVEQLRGHLVGQRRLDGTRLRVLVTTGTVLGPGAPVRPVAAPVVGTASAAVGSALGTLVPAAPGPVVATARGRAGPLVPAIRRRPRSPVLTGSVTATPALVVAPVPARTAAAAVVPRRTPAPSSGCAVPPAALVPTLRCAGTVIITGPVLAGTGGTALAGPAVTVTAVTADLFLSPGAAART